MAKHKVAERQIARILALLEHEPLSIIEIAARLHMSVTSVGRFVARLLAEKPRSRRLHIAGWRHGAVPTRPVKVLRAGQHLDVRYVRRGEGGGKGALRDEADRKRAEVLALLAMPQTTNQLAARTGIQPRLVREYLREHRAAGRVYIKAWLLPSGKGSQAPVYALGDLPDKQRSRGAVRPVSPARRSVFASAVGAFMAAC
jgi:predicted ArsR family transcriptional regulator